MTVTLQPVFESLGYADAVQQQALIKLLQVSGAFGDLPEVSNGLTDAQAKAILENLTFENADQAANWLHHTTQEHLLRPKGKERYEVPESEKYQSHHADIIQSVRNTGLLSQMQPSGKHYDHVLLMGTMESGVDTRLDTIKHLWEQGVRFDKIHMLGCERNLSPEFEPSAKTIGPRNEQVRTEMDMMEARYYAKSMDWPKELRDVRVFEVDTYNHPDGKRADSKETVASWVHMHPKAGNVLVISSQPLARYQEAAAKAVLPEAYKVEIASSAADNNTNVNVALDAFARQIDVSLPQVVAKLHAQKNIASTQLVSVDPVMLKLDPEAYQFRSGGDENGVTKEQRFNTDKWDPILHGNPILLHERLDGSLYVADGHHRVDLAKRLNEKGEGPGKLQAMVLSEKQGYSVEDVKLIAAYKNIAEGTANVVDAALVLKEAQSPAVHAELLPKLEMKRGNLLTAYKLSKLSDEALKTVAEGKVSADDAVKVSALINDPDHQAFALKELARRQAKVAPQQTPGI